jgi:hypothetical protein
MTVPVSLFTIQVRRIYPDHLPGRFTNSWLKRQAATPPARSRRLNVCGDGKVAMNKQMTVPADYMADQPEVDFWRCDVKADLSTPVKRALDRMQLQQQTAKELQC